MTRKNFIPLLQASLQGCVIETPHSDDIRTIVGTNQCGDAAPRLTGGWTGNEWCATEAVNLASLATFLQSEGWTAAATPQKVTVNGTELLAAFLMGCDFSSVMPGALRNDLEDGMKAQGFCL